MRGIFITLIITLSPISFFAQNVRWIYRYEGTTSYWYRFTDIVCGLDSNIYAGGYNYFYDDFFILSLTNAGEERWVYRYNGPGDSTDQVYSLVYGLDGNIYAAGFTTGEGTYEDFTVISLTRNGEERWVYRYNGTANNTDVAFSIVYGLDGNIYAAGSSDEFGTHGDLIIISLTTSGEERWAYRYNGTANSIDVAYSLVYGLDNNIYAAGIIWNRNTRTDFGVISVTNSGMERWVYSYSGPTIFAEEARSIAYGSDGNIYVAGVTQSSGTYGDFTVISLTNNGEERWVYKAPDTFPQPFTQWANAVIYGLDGNIYAAGNSPGSEDFMVISLAESGEERWVYRYNGTRNMSDEALAIVYGRDGNIYAAGESEGIGTYEDFTVISLTPSGEERWVYLYNGTANEDDGASSIACDVDGNTYAAGTTEDAENFHYFTIISFEPFTGITDDKSMVKGKPKDLIVPTFFSNELVLEFNFIPDDGKGPLKVILYNLLGSSVLEEEITSDISKTHLLINGDKIRKLKPGIYFLSLSSGKEKQLRKKIIKLR
ncbi:MAG: T9SS type A sorting domain-containing protein [candidate division WOR-3 bacterium]